MTTPETPQKFSTPEKNRQNLERSFDERMRKWSEALTELESIQRPLSRVEQMALKGLQEEIDEILTKPYELEDKKSFLRGLLEKIEKILNTEINH